MRLDAGLSQTELGLLMGWSKRTVINREKESFKLSLSEFEKFVMITTSTPEERLRRRQILNDIERAIDSLVKSVESKTSES